MTDIKTHIHGQGPHLVIQRPTPGLYRFKELNTYNNRSWWGPPTAEMTLAFQSGDKQVVGQNGLSPAALIAVLLDHLADTPSAVHLAKALDVVLGREPEPLEPQEDPKPDKPVKGKK